MRYKYQDTKLSTVSWTWVIIRRVDQWCTTRGPREFSYKLYFCCPIRVQSVDWQAQLLINFVVSSDDATKCAGWDLRCPAMSRGLGTYLPTSVFMCCWPCILVTFDFMFQLNVPFVYYIYQLPLHVSSNIVLIIRRIHCIHTASGSLYVTLLRWPLSAQTVRGPLTSCALSGHLRRMT